MSRKQIHWPSSWVKLEQYKLYPEDKDGNMITNDIPLTATWTAMEKLVESGKARSIGLSNFGDAYLEEILAMYGLPNFTYKKLTYPLEQILCLR